MEQIIEHLESSKDGRNNSKLLHLLNRSASDQETENIMEVNIGDVSDDQNEDEEKTLPTQHSKGKHKIDIKKVRGEKHSARLNI